MQQATLPHCGEHRIGLCRRDTRPARECERRLLIRETPLGVRALLGGEEPQRRPRRIEPLHGVVLPHRETELGARGEEPIRLVHATGDEIVDQHPDVRSLAAEDHRLEPQRMRRGIQSRDDPLPPRLLIPGGPVDLPREEEPRTGARCERGMELRRRHIVVLDRIARPRHHRSLEPGDRMQERELRIDRQRGGEPIHIELMCVQPLGLEIQLVPLRLGEAHDLVLDARAVARAARADRPTIHRRFVEPLLHDRLRRGLHVRDPA